MCAGVYPLLPNCKCLPYYPPPVLVPFRLNKYVIPNDFVCPATLFCYKAIHVSEQLPKCASASTDLADYRFKYYHNKTRTLYIPYSYDAVS